MHVTGLITGTGVKRKCPLTMQDLKKGNSV